MMLSIGTFSRLSGLSIKALRLYDGLHLLRPAEVDRRTGYRRYRLAQMVEAHRILALRQMGMSLDEVQSGRGDRAELVALRRALEEQMETLGARLAAVDESLARLESAPRPETVTPVVVKRIPATRVVARRSVIARFEDADALLDEMCAAHPVPIRGAVWHDCGSVTGTLDAEVFLHCASTDSAPRRELPAMLAASCFFGAGAEASGSAYDRLRSWMLRSGYQRAGATRELYYRIDGRELTEAQIPIVRASQDTPQHVPRREIR